jgi:aminopeptidase N
MLSSYLNYGIILALASLPMSATAATPASQLVRQVEQVTTQLPRGILPSLYDVAVTPHAQSLTFDGEVTVTLDVLQPTRSITLNALDLEFISVSLKAAGGTELPAPQVSVDAARQTATFTFAAPVLQGAYHLTMRYTGKIATQANGLFAIDYNTAAGRKRALFTQFEDADARRFLPCWDEPAYKAIFRLKATVPSSDMAISNMPIATTVDIGDGLTQVTFRPSPRMSSYLLFFSSGDFERATTTPGRTDLGVVTQRGLLSQAGFALESAGRILDYYNDYFDNAYPLPKLDNIASPGRSQFFSAMENWGAIFTFEHTLLLDPTISTLADRQRVFAVQAHETAHQWFGNLVTMSWWDDLWLNEGFASWMGARATEQLHPEWNTQLRAVAAREAAMNRDAMATTHPVVQHIETVQQARLAFDSITYRKGRAVISMLEDYVGPDKWRDGVRRYINRHAYGNTESDDLWRAVQEASGQPILDIARDFTLQPGIPMIKVDSAQCRDGKTTLRLSQGEFTRDRPEKKPLSWRVPVILQTLDGEPVRALVVDGHAGVDDLPGCGPLVVNAGQHGYYRTLYGPAGFARIRDSFGQLQPIDQLGVLADTWALGMAGLQPAPDFLELVQSVSADADPQVWQDIVDDLKTLDSYYRGEAARRARYREFASEKLHEVLARLGWDPGAREPDPVKILRLRLIETLGTLADPAVVQEARRRFDAQNKDPTAMPTVLRRSLLRVVAENADVSAWERIHAMARDEKTPMVRDEMYLLLSMSRDPALAWRALDLALTSEPGATVSASMVRTVSAEHPDLAFDFAVAHKDQVDAKIDPNERIRYYPSLAESSHDPAMPGKLNAFADKYIAAGSRRSADAAVENISYRIKLRAERLPAIDDWISPAQSVKAH